jgi:hypothetical protein
MAADAQKSSSGQLRHLAGRRRGRTGQLHSLEVAMSNAGLYTLEQIRQVNEHRMRARWQLGYLLGYLLRGTGPGRGKKMSPSETSFRAELKRIGLDRTVAMEAERISCMPKEAMEKVLAANHKYDVLNSFAGLVTAARPWWYAVSRKAKHQKIAATAVAHRNRRGGCHGGVRRNHATRRNDNRHPASDQFGRQFRQAIVFAIRQRYSIMTFRAST